MPKPPYLARKPRPTVDDLVTSAGISRAGTFRRLRPYVLGRPGVVEDLHHLGANLGWAVRFRQGRRDLCALVLWPDRLLAVVTLPSALQQEVLDARDVSDATKELVRASPARKGERVLRLPLEDRVQVADFRALVLMKGGGPPPRRRH